MKDSMNAMNPVYWHGLTLIPAQMINYAHNKMCGEMTYAFQRTLKSHVETNNLTSW